MNNIEWKNNQQLYSHYNKHVLGYNLEKYNISEPKIWKKHISDNISINKYELVSKDNIQGNHYLCKDKISNRFSINYCNCYDDDYLLTCIKIDDNNKNIYSCYFTDISHIHPFMNIYYFVNNLKKVNNEEYVSRDFTKYEIENTFDKYYLNAIKECNLDNPNYSDQDEISLLQMCILREFLKRNSYSKKNDKIIWINKLLFKKIDSIIKNEEYEFDEEEEIQLEKIYNEIILFKNDRDVLNDNKDTVDLLVEINNLINENNIIPSNKASRWTMFDNFKNWNK